MASYNVPKLVRVVDELPHTELGKVATELVRARMVQELADARQAVASAGGSVRE